MVCVSCVKQDESTHPHGPEKYNQYDLTNGERVRIAYQVNEGQSRMKKGCDELIPGLMASCNEVMMERADPMHCCKAASYDNPLLFAAIIGRLSDITAS